MFTNWKGRVYYSQQSWVEHNQRMARLELQFASQIPDVPKQVQHGNIDLNIGHPIYVSCFKPPSLHPGMRLH